MLMKVTFSAEELVRIDEARGQVPRATWVRRMALQVAYGRVVADAEPARGKGPTVEPGRSPEPLVQSKAEMETAMPLYAGAGPERRSVELPEHLQTGHPSVKPTHPAYHAQLAQIEQYRRDARA